MESNGTASVGVYMFYYAKTAQDPKFKLEDPREYTEENRLKVRFDPENIKKVILTTSYRRGQDPSFQWV